MELRRGDLEDAPVQVSVDLTADERERLVRYVPTLAAEWDLDSPGRRWRRVEGTLCFVDISGFTNLSEKLSRRGRIGAEELTEVLDRVFGEMLRLAYARGGALLKFGGDALLLMFRGRAHPVQSASAAVEMRAALRKASRIPTSVGRIRLRMSVGLHTGEIDVFRVGTSHHELVITGECATTTTEMESAADANQILISSALKRRLHPAAAPVQKGPGWLLKWRIPHAEAEGPVPRREVDPASVAGGVPTALRRHLRHGKAEPEHRIATVGFVKYKGIAAAFDQHGPEWVAEGLHRLISVVQAAVDEEDVTFLATDIDEDGGKVILVAGVPAVHEDDEGRILRAVRRIADADLAFPTRIGVNRGHVFAGEVGTDFRSTYTVMGDTVNLAARLMAAAPAGDVYASPGVLDRSYTLFETTPLEPFRVKGKEAPVQAYSVGRESGRRAAEATRELPFTGRAKQLEILRSALDSLEAPDGIRAFTITGHTGVGKTRLVEEALARHDAPMLTVRAEPQGTDNPYWAFRDPVRQWLGIRRSPQAEMAEALESAVAGIDPSLLDVLPLIGDVAHIDIQETEQTAAIEPRFRPDRTADAFIRLLESGHPGPLVVVAEDLHWMDDASLALVRRLSTVEERPWLVVATARAGDGELEEIFGEEIPLAALPSEESRDLAIAATSGAPLRPHEYETVVTRSGGNPLFLQEILRLVRESGSVEALPESLDAVAGAEIDALPPLTRRLLRYSSVLGRSYRKVVLDEFLAPEQVELDAATRRGLARFIDEDGPERWRFRHAVMHQVAYEGLSYRRRQELHARAGEVIERLAGDDPEAVAEFLANHYSLSGNHEKAWHYSKIAGDKAKAAYANVEAARHYQRALESARRIGVPDEERAQVHEDLGDVFERLGMFDAGIASYRRAQHSYPDSARKARVLFRQGRMIHRMGEYSRALQTLTRGLRVAEHATNGSDVAVDMIAQKASIRRDQGRYPDAIQLAQSALSRAGEGTISRGVALAEMITDLSHTALGQSTDHAATRRAWEISLELGDLRTQAWVSNALGAFAYYEGDWDEAVELYSRSIEAFRRTGDEIAAAYGRANVAEILADQGHLDEAEAAFEDVLPVWRSAEDYGGVAFLLTLMGRIYARTGRIGQALEVFDEALQIFESIGAATELVDVTLRRAEALAIAEGHHAARNMLDSSGSAAPEEAPAQLRPLAYRVHGLVTMAGGDHTAGERQLRRSYTEADSLGSDIDLVAAVNTLGALGIVEPEWSDRAAQLSAKLGIISAPVIRLP